MSEVDFLVKLRDAACMVHDACEERLQTFGPPGVKDEKAGKNADIDMLKIPWVAATGSKGAYESADDPSNLEFQKLSTILGEHKGKMRIGPYFVWQFTNATKIGRKKSQ